MDQSIENRIRERAYEIWTTQGCVHGQADRHWLAAERKILAAAFCSNMIICLNPRISTA